jgi:hypothetical protein
LLWLDLCRFDTTTRNGWNGDGLKPSLRWQKFETSAAQTFNYLVAGGGWHVMMVISWPIKVLWLRSYHHLKWLEQWRFETATRNGWNSDGLKPSLRWQKFETSAAQTFNYLVASNDWHVMMVISWPIKVLWLRSYHHLKWLEQWRFETTTRNGWNGDGLKPSLRWQEFETSAVQPF